MKRIVCVLLCVCMLLSSALVALPCAAYSVGDLNNDGKFNAVDSNLMRNCILGNDTQAPATYAADINGDGKINSSDAVLILMVVLGSYEISAEPYPVTEIKLGGTDITQYSVLLPDSFPEWGSEANYRYAAEIITSYVKDACGVILPVTENNAGHVIALSYDESLGADGFTIEVENGKCTVRGGAPRGLMYGAFGLLEEFLDYRFYPYGVTKLGGEGKISVDAGYTHTEGTNTPFMYRDVYTYSKIQNKYPGAYTSKFRTSVLASHIVGRWLNNGWQNVPQYGYCYGPDRNHSCYALMPNSVDGDVTVGKVCFSSKDTLNECVGNLRTYLATFDPDNLPMVSISQNDSADWCSCRACNKIIDKYGARISTLVEFVRKLSAELLPEYPDLKFWSLSYLSSEKPPVGQEIPDNMYICFCEYYACNNHAIVEEPCAPDSAGVHNTYLNLYREDWMKITDNIHIWYYTVNYYYSVVSMPILRKAFLDTKYYAEHGIKGIFFENEDTTLGFEPLKSYMLSELLWNPDITWEEYDARIRTFLNDWYGEAGDEMYEILWLMEDAGDAAECFCGLGDAPNYCYNYDFLCENYDRVCELFDKAESEVTGEWERENLERLSCQIYFNVLSAAYESRWANGTDSERADFEARYKTFYNRFKTIKGTYFFSFFEGATGVTDSSFPATDEVTKPLDWYSRLFRLDKRWDGLN